jgi:CheY-like chemotaxis protein
VFVEKSKVKVSKIDGYLESFQKHLGFDDSEMEALKRDEFDSLPNVFASKPYVTQIAGLVLRNINRFVTNDFYFDRIKKTDRLDYRSMVAQRCDGDIDVCIGFATEENYDALSVIASKYSGEDCGGRSIETYDGVGEFINCVSGLLSTTLSQNDVNIEIKPQMAYENQTAVGSAYILPMFVDNKPVTLYIAVDSDVNVGNVPVIHKVQAQAGKPVEEGKGTVLIVDDSGMSRKMLRNLLEEAGYAVVAEASDGLEGVTAYKQYNPNVVTLDITMPNMDGIEALKQIMDYDEGAKAIMITAAGQQNKIIEALKIGAEKFITKPYDKDEVLKTVNELINKK